MSLSPLCRSRFTCTRQPDRYDVQPESQARVAIVTRQPDRYDVQPESQALLLCRRMHGSSRFATSPTYQRAPPIGQHPPDPPTVKTRAGLAIGRTPPPPPSVVGRNGRRGEISRTSRRNSLFTAAPPVNNRDHPPPSAVGPVVARAEFGSQSSPGHNTHPSKAHTHRRLTLTPARTYKVAPQFVVRQPFLPQT